MSNYLFFDKNLVYPENNEYYSPKTAYPEIRYKNDNYENNDNAVYDAIRQIFYELGLDCEHYGLKEWNPLRKFIKPGQKVLIKPNFVMHRNMSDNPDDMDSLVTHPSVIRVIIDYCLIALEGEGSLIIADAPVKDCDFALLMKKAGYDKLVEFYRLENVKPMPEFLDLRGIGEEGGQYKQGGHGVLVNLGKNSLFYDCNLNSEMLRIPNYDYRKVIKHHKGETQEYMINSLVLEADVIISIPKPKTHRKNGYTGALKNFVGISYSKEFLPHHTKGDVESGGDEYKKATEFKYKQSELRERIDIVRERIAWLNRTIPNTPTKIFRYPLIQYLNYLERRQSTSWREWGRLAKEDDQLMEADSRTNVEKAKEGAWYGNDTLWRTVLDLNIAVEYANQLGKICDKKQRKILYLGDMIVAGEKEGPMSPSPKSTHSLLFSENPVEFDAILVKLMGFNWQKFTGLCTAMELRTLSECTYEKMELSSNIDKFNNRLCDVQFTDYIPFEPTSGWKGYIEL